MRHSGKVWTAAEWERVEKVQKMPTLELLVTIVAAELHQTGSGAGLAHVLLNTAE